MPSVTPTATVAAASSKPIAASEAPTTGAKTKVQPKAKGKMQFGSLDAIEVTRVVERVIPEKKLPWVTTLPREGEFRKWKGPVSLPQQKQPANGIQAVPTSTPQPSETAPSMAPSQPQPAPAAVAPAKSMSWADRTKKNIPAAPATAVTNGTTSAVPSSPTAAQPPATEAAVVAPAAASTTTTTTTTTTATPSALPNVWATGQVAKHLTGRGINGVEPKLVPFADAMANYELKFNAPLLQPRGMLNSNNTCYMNAILQPLCHLAPFYNLFCDIKNRVTHNINSETPLVEAMVTFVKEFHEATRGEEAALGEPFAPAYVYDMLRKLKKFDSLHGQQEDADEFLGSLLDALHEEFNKACQKTRQPENSDGANWLEVGKKKKVSQTRTMEIIESPISRMFWGRQRSVVRRTSSQDSITLEPFRSLHLDISADNVNSIGDAIMNLATTEVLDSSTPSGTSNKPMTVTKQNLLEDLPPVLVLHLKRFHYDPIVGTQKLRRRVAYDTRFRFPREATALKHKDQQPEYTLLSVIYHHGLYAAGGHYTCDVRRQDGTWLRMNDTTIAPIAESEVRVSAAAAESAGTAADWSTPTDWDRSHDGDAYLLFYVDTSRLPTTAETRTSTDAQPEQGSRPNSRKRPTNSRGERR